MVILVCSEDYCPSFPKSLPFSTMSSSHPASCLEAIVRLLRRVFLSLLFLPTLCSAQSSLVDRVGNTGFVRVEADSFKSLTPQQQQLAYWLTQASIAVDPIIYDQFSSFGLRQKRVLEELWRTPIT